MLRRGRCCGYQVQGRARQWSTSGRYVVRFDQRRLGKHSAGKDRVKLCTRRSGLSLHADIVRSARRAVRPRDRLLCAAEGRLVTKLPPRVDFPMPRLRVAALPAPTDFRDGCGSGDVSWRGLLRSATTAIERQRRIAAGKVARRLPPVTDRKKFSDDFLARARRRARLARHALDEKIEVCGDVGAHRERPASDNRAKTLMLPMRARSTL